PFVAVIMNGQLASLFRSGVPLRVAVPLLLSMKDNQIGRGPVRVTREVGVPVVVMPKVPCVPILKVVLAVLVIAGACAMGAVSCTVNVNVCVALGRVPLAAVIVIG